MANFSEIKKLINAIINTNGRQAITGKVMNATLVKMMDSVEDAIATKEDKETGKGLSSNDYTDAEKKKLASLENYDDSEVKDTLSALAKADTGLAEAVGKKVDKVAGKQLTTEDFTTALKQKLESLNNYDDAQIQRAVSDLRTEFDTLLSGNPTKAIESFNEIIAFLNGVEDSENLDSIIAGIEKQIASVSKSLENKVDKVAGKGLSTYDFNTYWKDQIQRGVNEPEMLVWIDLLERRDNNDLIAGRLYRITDYVTTTSQENTRSAGHRFDIIVLALDGHTLAEEAWAIASEFNIEEYKDAYSETWGDRMIYLGTYDYNGNTYHLYESESKDLQMLVDFDNLGVVTPGISSHPYNFSPAYTKGNDEEWQDGREYGEMIAFKTCPNYFADNGANLSAWKIWYCLDNNKERFAWADKKNGKGVIYRMIDEWGNDCPYDFKNIQFLRGIYADGAGIAKEEGDGDYEVFCYTFSWEDDGQVIMDASIFGNNGYILNDEAQIMGVYDNTIKSYITYTGEFESPSVAQQHLNNIVFFSTFGYDDGLFYGCYGNSFGLYCYDNNFGNQCYNNIFCNYCTDNKFSDGNYDNSFGNECGGNSFGNACSNNSFGNACVNNSFGYGFNHNSFGNACSNNSFGNMCTGNSFGCDCNNNSFGEECTGNSFGNQCGRNSFGDSCYTNSFGNGCYANIFGFECINNILGNECHDNNFGDNCFSNNFGNNCYGNSFGNGCYNNSFGNGCVFNSFGNNCYGNSFGNEFENNTFIDMVGAMHGLSYNRFDNGVHDVQVYVDQMPEDYQSVRCNHVCNGVSGNIEFYADETYGRTYTINSDGEVKEFVLGDLV